MKSVIKRVLKALLGEKRASALAQRLRGEHRMFSEADLIFEWFDSQAQPGVMVDVGANIGSSLAPYLERGWKIYAFEPDPANRAELRRLVDVSKIRLFDCAVSDHEEEGVPFYASPESNGISSLSAFRDTHREVNRVRLTTLDRIFSEQQESQVNFLKIDTEGHDLFVLKGFPWKRIKPNVVLCEFEDAKTVPLGYDYRQMGDLLVAQGYEVFLSEWAPIVRYGVQHQWLRWTKYPAALNNPKGWGNFVAFRPGQPLKPVERYLERFNTTLAGN